MLGADKTTRLPTMKAPAPDQAAPNLMCEFIEIPAWNARGMVIAQRPARHGADEAVEVLLQAGPDARARTDWFHLEPGEYVVL